MRDDLAEALRAPEAVLVVPGRRSGEQREVTVWFAYEDGVVWLRTDRDADWYRNLVVAGRCRLRFGAVEIEGSPEAVTDEASALRHVVAIWRAKYGVDFVSDWYVDHGRVPVRIRLQLDSARHP
jgi:hypothetical protein